MDKQVAHIERFVMLSKELRKATKDEKLWNVNGQKALGLYTYIIYIIYTFWTVVPFFIDILKAFQQV